MVFYFLLSLIVGFIAFLKTVIGDFGDWDKSRIKFTVITLSILLVGMCFNYLHLNLEKHELEEQIKELRDE